jgi:anti-sigma regulatory factor (Ser/Thr protein kinase)
LSSRYCEWRLEIPATIEAIDQFCTEFHLWRECNCADLDAFDAELLLREALTNSVVHGSKLDPGKRISCVVRVKRGRVVIGIRDEGVGFDWRALWDRQAEPTATHGRGIEIFRSYANAVRFNQKGNAVTLVKRF